MTKIETMNSLKASHQEIMMNQIILDDHLLNQISATIEPLSETMMILSESVSIELNQTQETLMKVNKSLEMTTHTLTLAQNILGQQTKKLEEQNSKLHKYSTELKNNTIKNQLALIVKVASLVGIINMLAVLSVGYFTIQKELPQPTINLDSKVVATSIVEQLRLKR
ncbi:Uncharacterised protein [Klebsiella pneumoniae]|nr:hypothetical protein APT85_16155 [Klebsiella pneumoniae]SWG39156.1 Uncharacterised protein [Klebsiella pneumoniae]SXM32982.1 Uncharacterised protein [Klebsiella pneumoniae]SYR89995.1 Uncharacterised protein [Klebsiella pneumoniae]